MQTNTIFKFLGASVVCFMLAACGGSSKDSALQNSITGVNGGTSAGSSSSTNTIGKDTLQSIEFKDATPAIINLKGTGGTESSLVRFRVLGQTGAPIKDIDVDFTLTSNVGDIKLSQASGKSDIDGYISTSVISGTVSTSIRVTATAKEDSAISTQSNQLVVATGLPDQKSMSLGLEIFNPAGWDHNLVTSKLTVQLADAYNNPAADGTAVSFTTEGGSVQASCTTSNGACTVTWTSQDPRPPRNSSDNSVNRILCLDISNQPLIGQAKYTCQAERAGRSTILAAAIGNESFKDQNGNGIFDPGIDVFTTSETGECTPNVPPSSFEATTGACDDLPEAYLDTNESGTHQTGEPFINFITDTTHDAETDNYSPHNGLYNGAFCQPTDEKNGLCSRAPVTIRKQHLVIMSSDKPLLLTNNILPKVGTGKYAAADEHGNPLPIGSTITVGTNPPITVGNQHDYNIFDAAAMTPVTLTIAISTSSSITISANTGP